METVNIISIIKDIVLGLSALTVAILALIGLNTWRKELTGRAKFETARNMMRLSLKFQANLEGVRFPVTHYSEYANRTKQAGESISESSVLDEWYAKTNRINAVFENLTTIVQVKWEAEILLDESSVQNVIEAVKSYTESYANLSTAISDYFSIRYDEVRTGNPYIQQDYIKELKNIISSIPSDDFSTKVNDATDKLSSALKQYVR